jgi:hypothetical protein
MLKYKSTFSYFIDLIYHILVNVGLFYETVEWWTDRCMVNWTGLGRNRACFKSRHYTVIILKELKKTQYSRCSGRDSNRTLSEYESRALPLR